MTDPATRTVHPMPQQGERLVSLHDVGVRRHGRWLVHSVSLDVYRGEIVTLIGPNGGGKTTTLRVLLGLTAPDSGSVERQDDLSIGYVPQRVNIDRILPLTVARLMTLTRRHRAEDVAAALGMTGVGHSLHQPVHELSGGEFQRVLLARAMLGKPDLLVLDEPVQGVDYAGESELYQLIEQLREHCGCGILLVSHDLHIVMAATDRVVCLNQHVCCTGAPHDVARHEEYQRLFGSRAVPALAVYEHHHDHHHGIAGEVVPIDSPGSEQD